MAQGNLQVELFRQVQQQFPNKADVSEVLGGLLGVSRESIFRRLSGETALTPDGIQVIAERFQIHPSKNRNPIWMTCKLNSWTGR
jgi:hypothetical protein